MNEEKPGPQMVSWDLQIQEKQQDSLSVLAPAAVGDPGVDELAFHLQSGNCGRHNTSDTQM